VSQVRLLMRRSGRRTHGLRPHGVPLAVSVAKQAFMMDDCSPHVCDATFVSAESSVPHAARTPPHDPRRV